MLDNKDTGSWTSNPCKKKKIAGSTQGIASKRHNLCKKSGRGPNIRMKKRKTKDISYSLISAVREGRLERVKKIIDAFGLSYSQAWMEGYVLLCKALEKKHTEITKQLLIKGSKVNNNRSYSSTPLHLAVENGDIEIVKMILSRGSDIHAKNCCGKTPLYEAINNMKIEITELLLNQGADPNAGDLWLAKPIHIVGQIGYTTEHLVKHGIPMNCMHLLTRTENFMPLHIAVEKGNEEIIKLLLSRNVYIDVRGKDGITPLHIASEKGYLQIAELLLDRGAHVNCAYTGEILSWRAGYTPLHLAVEKGNEEMIKLLLSRNAYIDAFGKDGTTPLHIAVEKGYLQIAEHLLKHGAHVNCVHTSTQRRGYTPLHFAAENGSEEIIKLLLSSNAYIDATATNCFTPLRIALENGHDYAIKVLLDHGADICLQGYNKTILHIAVEKGYLKIVELLLKYGINVNLTSRKGYTSLHSATIEQKKEIATLLISYGADVNAKDEAGKTPIFYATRNKDFQITELLLINGADTNNDPNLLFNVSSFSDTDKAVSDVLFQYGFDINDTNENGTTTLHIASTYWHIPFITYLLEHGPDINITDKYNRTPLYISRSRYSYKNDEMHNPVRLILKQHAVKLKAANLYVSESNLTYIRNSHLRGFENECEKEIESMKNEKINNNVSFYDILTKNINQLARYARNETIVQVLQSVDYKIKFRKYGVMVNNRFKKGVRRKELLEQAEELLHSFFSVLPYNCTEKICSYLNERDLSILTLSLRPTSPLRHSR